MFPPAALFTWSTAVVVTDGAYKLIFAKAKLISTGNGEPGREGMNYPKNGSLLANAGRPE